MVKISDEEAWNRSGKLSNSPSLIPSSYCYYFHTLIIPSQDPTFPCKPAASLDFMLSLAFSYTIHVPLHLYI